MTFKEWLLKFEEVDLPIGDLAVHAAFDKKFPNTRDYDQILAYLVCEVKASSQVITVYRAAYAYYKDSCSLRLYLKK